MKLPKNSEMWLGFDEDSSLYVPRSKEVVYRLKELNMSHLRHWKLARSPFAVSPTGRNVFTGGSIEEALARCDFLVAQEKRLGLVIGPSGVGKTTFLKHFGRTRANENPRERMALVDLRSAHSEIVPARILQSLAPHESIPTNVQDCWSKIQDCLFSESAIGHRTVILLDNVHDVGEDIYQAVSQLWCLDMQWSMLLAVDDETIVNLPRWILDQCELKIDLPCWDLAQTADYFDFALSRAGLDDPIFNGQAITRIQELSEGIPRKIAQIAELALVAGAVRRSEKVTSELIDQVCDEFIVAVGPKFSALWEEQRLNAG
jgi:general secretion pathway protein A